MHTRFLEKSMSMLPPSFKNFVKSMPPSLSDLRFTPSFCFAFKIPDDCAVTSLYTSTILRHFFLDFSIYLKDLINN